MEKISSITPEILKEAYSYSAFNRYTESLFEKGLTTNNDNSEGMLNYTKLNISRTHRWDKRAKISVKTQEVIQSIELKQVWLVITEGWCGDSAQILPFINKMAELNSNIELKIILRDEHPEIMDEFLTDGKSRSIPKVVVLEADSLEVLGSWGPRPIQTHKTYLSERLDPEVGGKKASENLHIWYARDKGITTQLEFTSFLKNLF
ncbi:MAG: thioredoxin family protein [Balneolaceae bacterium]